LSDQSLRAIKKKKKKKKKTPVARVKRKKVGQGRPSRRGRAKGEIT